MTAPPDLARLDTEKYVSLVTIRRNGDGVPTPVWFAVDGEALVVTTEASSGKVKRVRANPRVTVTPCDMRGRVTGETRAGTARLLAEADWPRATAMIDRKYGLVKRVFDLGSWAVRTVRRSAEPERAMIEITLDPR